MAEKANEKKQKFNVAILLAVVIPSLAVFFSLIFLLNRPGVPFQTFKSNYLASKNVSIVATFYNQSEFVEESSCVAYLRELMPFANVSYVHVYFINKSNNTCTYSPTILPITIKTTPASYCLSLAYKRPSIFLNYSTVNASIVTAYRLTILGNDQYMQQCPIAVDMS